MRLFWHQLKAEQRIFWRNRESAVFIFIFPPMLFLLLGSVYDGTIEIDGREFAAANVLLGGMIGYGAANTGFAGTSIVLVVRREYAILKRLRSTPLPAPVYVGAMLGLDPDRLRAPDGHPVHDRAPALRHSPSGPDRLAGLARRARRGGVRGDGIRSRFR